MPTIRWGSMAAEILPLAAFFAGNALYDLYVAAVASTLLAIGLLALVWWRERRIARFMVFSVALAMVCRMSGWRPGRVGWRRMWVRGGMVLGGKHKRGHTC